MPRPAVQTLEYRGETRTLSQWGRIVGLRPSVIRTRLRAGWSVERTFETPLRRRYSQKIDLDFHRQDQDRLR